MSVFDLGCSALIKVKKTCDLNDRNEHVSAYRSGRHMLGLSLCGYFLLFQSDLFLVLDLNSLTTTNEGGKVDRASYKIHCIDHVTDLCKIKTLATGAERLSYYRRLFDERRDFLGKHG
jgi:hypothetical protein